MNKFIKEQLSKLKIAKITNISEDGTRIFISKSNIPHLVENEKEYIFEILDNSLKYKKYKGEITTISNIDNTIKVMAYPMDENDNVVLIPFSGWLNLNNINIKEIY